MGNSYCERHKLDGKPFAHELTNGTLEYHEALGENLSSAGMFLWTSALRLPDDNEFCSVLLARRWVRQSLPRLFRAGHTFSRAGVTSYEQEGKHSAQVYESHCRRSIPGVIPNIFR